MIQEIKNQKFRMYIDEVGNADLSSSGNPNQRFLCLAGVIMELNYVEQVAHKAIESLKRKYFRSHPDEPIILHRKELVNKKPPFESLRDAKIEESFNHELIRTLDKLDFRVVAVLIDKLEHKKRYQVWRYDPYHYCLAILVERYVTWLIAKGVKGDVMSESRGGKEDMRLKASYAKLHAEGTEDVTTKQFAEALTSKELKVKPKSNNITGLQIADIIAHPISKQMIAMHLQQTPTETFGTQIYTLLINGKFNTSPSGQVEGWGMKWLP